MAKLVLVKNYYDISEAHIAKGLLEYSGISAFLFDINMASMNWMFLNAISGIRLMVDEVDLDRATEILTVKDENVIGESVDNCPSCKSSNVFRHPSWMTAFIAFISFGLILLTSTNRRTCRQCGHKWKAD